MQLVTRDEWWAAASAVAGVIAQTDAAIRTLGSRAPAGELRQWDVFVRGWGGYMESHRPLGPALLNWPAHLLLNPAISLLPEVVLPREWETLASWDDTARAWVALWEARGAEVGPLPAPHAPRDLDLPALPDLGSGFGWGLGLAALAAIVAIGWTRR